MASLVDILHQESKIVCLDDELGFFFKNFFYFKIKNLVREDLSNQNFSDWQMYCRIFFNIEQIKFCAFSWQILPLKFIFIHPIHLSSA